MTNQKSNNGICYLVGAGPGDPGLLTLKAVECLKKSTVVYYDYLASQEVLNFAPTSAKLIYVGKSAGQHAMPQAAINSRLIKSVAAGEIVTRLKGGDPFVFGRGGEEALALQEAGLRFEIIPGISSGIAAAAYAGIPVTHRALATMVTFVTGHETPEKDEPQTDWEALARTSGTICVYMGMKNLDSICKRLIQGGREPNEQVAVVYRGTSSAQKTLTGTLEDISDKVEAAGMTPPAMIIIGKVVNLRQNIAWFEHSPLFGKRILVTRAREQASQLSDRLRAYGATIIEIPALKIIPMEYHASTQTEQAITNGIVKIAYMRQTNPTLLSMIQDKPMALDFPDLNDLLKDCDELTRGIAMLVANKHEWAIFTSVNSVEHTFERIKLLGLDTRIFVGKEVAAIGSATAEALLKYGIRADLVPEIFTGEALLQALISRDISKLKIIMFRASNARAMLREELHKLGCEVDDITAYRVGKAPLSPEHQQILEHGEYDIATFASSATVRNFLEMSGSGIAEILAKNTQPKFISIGPITSETLCECSIPVSAEAKEATIEALVETIIEIVGTTD